MSFCDSVVVGPLPDAEVEVEGPRNLFCFNIEGSIIDGLEGFPDAAKPLFMIVSWR